MYYNILDQEFRILMDEPDTVVIDVRTPEEIRTGFIPGTSIFLDINNASFRDKIQALDKSKQYLIYCRSGARSARACKLLDEQGFSGPFYNLAKGITCWKGELRIP